MDAQSILLITTAAISLLFWFLIFLKKRKNKRLFCFGFVTLSSVLWSGLTIGYRLLDVDALMWVRLVYSSALLFSLSLFYFSLIFPGDIKINKFSSFLFFLPALGLIFLTIFTDFIIESVTPAGLYNAITFGTLYVSYFLCFSAYFLASFIFLLSGQKKHSGIVRIQIEYILIGLVFAWFTAMVCNIFLPLIDIFSTDWLGQLAGFLLVCAGSYSLLKNRPTDLRVVAKRIVIYTLSSVFVYAIFYFIVWLFILLFGSVHNTGAYTLGLIVAPLFVILFVQLNNRIRRVADRYVFSGLYSHQKAIAKLAEELTNFIDLNKIVDSILKSIKELMQIEKAGILLIEKESGITRYETPQVFGFSSDDLKLLIKNSFFSDYSPKSPKILTTDEAQSARAENDPELEQLLESMELIGASLCFPMIVFEKLIGIIVLGKKSSGDPYTDEDLSSLGTLSKQAAIAIYNARLYKEVQDFNKNLQQKINQQTKEIKEAYEVEKQAHEELKKLDEAKNNFMLVTQHHLRTPLSVTRGYLDLLLKGVYGKIPKKVVEILNIMEKSTRKEIDVVNDLLSVSPYQLGKAVIRIEDNVSMIDMLMKIVGDLKAEADKKNIYLKFESSDDIPEILADKNQLKVALYNVVDNAIKYTKKGGVTVKVSKEPESMILISVEDTGVGMSPEEQRTILNKPFQRGKDIWKIDVVGKGIGLYISSQIIKAHGGKIWVESDGKNKGSIFFAQLPVNKNSL